MARIQPVMALVTLALFASGVAATQVSRDCLGGCAGSHPSFEPVCRDGRMWYNACYMLCQAPNVTVYERCPASPSPSPVRSRPPPPSCDPQRYPYATQTYHCESDCRTYTLVDVNAGCMPNWAGASAYCESRGLELAPWDTDASNGALRKLCAANRFTCWAGGRTPDGLCPLMTQEGYMQYQGCEQPVRFVCRTKTSMCSSPPPPSPNPPSPRPPSPNPPSPRPPSPSPPSPPPPSPNPPSPPPPSPNPRPPPPSPAPPSPPPPSPLPPSPPPPYPPSPAPPMPPPPPSPVPPSPPPPPVCNPRTAPYKNTSYYCQNDCRTYTLYDIDAICMVNYGQARAYCERTGGELVPYGEAPAMGALHKLCRDNRYTCWTGGRDERSGLCPLMTQEGHIVQQGCEQPVRWVCRTKNPRCPSPPPSPAPPSPAPPSPAPSYPPPPSPAPPSPPPPPSPAPPSPLPPSPPPPYPPSPAPPLPPPPPSPAPPSPAPPPVCDPRTAPYKNTSYYCQNDCRTYTLYDIDAICMVDYGQARAYCERTGGELVPYGEAPAFGALHKLCRDRRYTCWTGGRDERSGLCPLMTADGDVVQQGCGQHTRWVCRTKGPGCSPPPPSPSPPSPPPPPSPRPPSPPPPSPQPPSPQPPRRQPPSPQPPSPAPPSPSRRSSPPNSPISCEATCDLKYHNWYVWVCDKGGQAYRNWCYAACHGCYLYTPCAAPRDSGEPATGDNVLSLRDGGYLYRMWTVDAQQRRTYADADAFCAGLDGGGGWALVPYTDLAGYGAVRRLCANNSFTCWLKRGERDEQYPLMAADGSLQMQGPEQRVRFVCRQRQQQQQ